MFSLFLMILTSFLISMLFLIITTLTSKKTNFSREKLSPFECGFNTVDNTVMPFSMKFFLIAIIFIIFDVEIVLIIPLIETALISNLKKWVLISIIFLVIILVGILMEWKETSLDWKTN